MLTFYYCPGACSMAAHVALEEIGARYEGHRVKLSEGEQRSAAYLSVNPRAQVPALSVGGKVITESVAILTYLARAFPEAQLIPPDDVGQARCQATMTWISSAVDPLFRRAARPERFVAYEGARPAVKRAAEEAYWSKCQEIDALIGGNEWITGAQYTVCDPYALVYYGFALRFGFPLTDLTAYTRLKNQLLSRPAVRKVLEREQHPLLA
jgi:glutathione S-transferase